MITKIFGAAGTGKTTTLKNILHDSHVSIKNEVVFLSFANAALFSMGEKLGYTDKTIKNYKGFRTIHGASLSHVLTVNPEMERLINKAFGFEFIKKYYRTYCKRNSIRYSYDEEAGNSGNIAMQLWNKIASENYPKYQSIEKCLSILSHYNYEAYSIISDWQDYKKSNDGIDWTDILIEAYETDINAYSFTSKDADIKLGIIDEAQDMSALEWAIADKIISEIPEVNIAGDDYQAIYDFKGANPELFLSHEGKQKILPITRRLPANVLDFSDKIARKMKIKQYKEITTEKGNGNLEIKNSNLSIKEFVKTAIVTYANAQQNKKSTYLLFRTNYQAEEARAECTELGFLPKNLKNDKFFNEHLPIICTAIEKHAKNQKLSLNEWEVITNYLDSVLSTELRKKLVTHIQSYSTVPIDIQIALQNQSLINILKDSENTHMKRLFKNETLAQKLSNGLKPINLAIDTIHSSKGLEANNIILADGITQKIKNSIKNEYNAFDNELRVSYVACTRAMDSLQIHTCKGLEPFICGAVI